MPAHQLVQQAAATEQRRPHVGPAASVIAMQQKAGYTGGCSVGGCRYRQPPYMAAVTQVAGSEPRKYSHNPGLPPAGTALPSGRAGGIVTHIRMAKPWCQQPEYTSARATAELGWRHTTTAASKTPRCAPLAQHGNSAGIVYGVSYSYFNDSFKLVAAVKAVIPLAAHRKSQHCR